MDSTDIFDNLDHLRLPASGGFSLDKLKSSKHAGPAAKSRKSKDGFVKVPLAWADRLKRPSQIGTYPVAIHLLYQHWRNGGKPVVLSNVALEGVKRWQKWRALRELEDLGLVKIERRRCKSPRVTVLMVP